jgi:hypothetical protein
MLENPKQVSNTCAALHSRRFDFTMSIKTQARKFAGEFPPGRSFTVENCAGEISPGRGFAVENLRGNFPPAGFSPGRSFAVENVGGVSG